MDNPAFPGEKGDKCSYPHNNKVIHHDIPKVFLGFSTSNEQLLTEGKQEFSTYPLALLLL